MAKRRPSGDGLVRKREDGRWEGRIVVGHKRDGSPIFKSVFGKTQYTVKHHNKHILRTNTCHMSFMLFKISERRISAKR